MRERAYCDCHVNIWTNEQVLPLYGQQLGRVRQGEMAPKADADPGLAGFLRHGGRFNRSLLAVTFNQQFERRVLVFLDERHKLADIANRFVVHG